MASTRAEEAAMKNNDVEAQIKEIQKLKTAIENVEDIINSGNRESVAIFLGPTKCGKSTLVNHLIGNQLATKRERLTDVYIVKQDPIISGPEIGVQTVSQTTGPSRWESARIPGLVLWDCPGFEDNRGEIKDITNAYYIKQLLQTVESAKIVLLVDVECVSGAVNRFVTLLNSLESILQENFCACFGSVATIFTKVPPTICGEEVTKELFADLLRQRFLSEKELLISPDCRKFIEFLCSNIGKIGYFKRAMQENAVIDGTYDVDIIAAIENARFIPSEILKAISPSISHQSQCYLYRVKYLLCDVEEFDKLFTKFKNEYITQISNIEDNIHDDRVENCLQAIIKIEAEIDMYCGSSEDTSCRTILRNIEFNASKSVKEFLKDNKLAIKLKLVEFIDSILGYNDQLMILVKLKELRSVLKNRVEQSKIKIKIKQQQLSHAEAQRLIDLERQRYETEVKHLNERLKKYEAKNNSVKNFFANIAVCVDKFVEVCAVYGHPAVGSRAAVHAATKSCTLQ